MKHLRTGLAGLLLFLILGLAACGGKAEPSAPADTTEAAGTCFEPFFSESLFRDPETLCEGVSADLSESAKGYAGLSVVSDKKIVVQVLFGELKYNYTALLDGTPFFIPFQFGDGVYKLRIMQNTVDNKYIQLAAREIDVKLDSEFEPFLRANRIVSYDESSAVVKKAAELAAEAGSELDYVKRVYDFVTKTLRYDNAFAKTVKEGYVPTPDATLESKKGICFDYSSLAAAMLRSQGIPTKVITGYVGKEGLYHAWNCIYIQGTGWVTVELKVKRDDWYRVDTTMGTSGELTDSGYVDRYVY